MEYKYVEISESVSIPVPKGLTPEDEGNFIAGRIAFVNFEELESQCRDAIKCSDEGKLVTLRSVLEELENDGRSKNGKSGRVNLPIV